MRLRVTLRAFYPTRNHGGFAATMASNGGPSCVRFAGTTAAAAARWE
jgi:hypothetical protein